ncbi:GCN5-like 1, partial [Chytriomyces sp. MP71]
VRNLSDVLVEQVNTPVSAAFKQQQLIETLERSLGVETRAFATQSRKWVALVANLNASLKELGHVENWVTVIAQDVAAVAAVLGEVEPGQVTAAPVSRAGSFWS